MRTIHRLLLIILALNISSCTEDVMDEVNRELNNTTEMGLDKLIPDILLKSAVESTGTDMAWYSSVYMEHNTGSWNQMNNADIRAAQEAGTNLNNSWNALYDVMNTCHLVLERTGAGGEDEGSMLARGIAQVMMAYNLAIVTDGWGEVPFTEAFQGAQNLQPAYENQSVIYGYVDDLLNEALTSLEGAEMDLTTDLIYGGDPQAWIRAAWSLKARYAMRLSLVKGAEAASSDALAALANGFSSAGEALIFDHYEASATGENPWFQFFNDRSQHSCSQSLYNLLDVRNDPRMNVYWTTLNDTIRPAPNGTSDQTQGGVYSQSLITVNGRTRPTPLMTYHELLFIKAEAEFRTSAADWQTSLQAAIEENFVFHGLDREGGASYFTNEVLPLLSAGNELNEILTQKYIAFYEHEAMEAYNDYRRTRIPEMTNPNNELTGFVWRYPRPTSETSSNSANVPDTDIYEDKLWWSGGSEKL